MAWDFDTTCPTGVDTTGCPSKLAGVMCGYTHFDAFNTWTEAKAGCIARGSECYGVLDTRCDNSASSGTHKLCVSQSALMEAGLPASSFQLTDSLQGTFTPFL